MNDTKIVEVNGTKVELSLERARVIDSFRIGDKVKLLKKDYQTWKVYPAVLIGFENFTTLPTMVVAYLDASYNDAKIEIQYINAESKDVELTKAVEKDFDLSRSFLEDCFDRKIAKAKNDLAEAEHRKAYFITEFGKFFDEGAVDGQLLNA